MRNALAEAAVGHELRIGVQLVMVAGQPGVGRDIADIDGPAARGHRVAQLEILEELSFGIVE